MTERRADAPQRRPPLKGDEECFAPAEAFAPAGAVSSDACQFLFESLSQGCLICDGEGRILAANRAAADLLGHSVDELRGRPACNARWEVRDADGGHLPLEEWPVLAALRSGRPVHERLLEVRRRAGEDARWLMVTAIPRWRSGDRSPGEVCVTFVDVTAQRQAEQALHKSGTMLATILDSVPQSIFWKDLDGVYLGCNEVFARAVGMVSPADVVGKTDYDLPWPRTEAEAYRADDREVIEARRAKRHIIEPVQQADGRRVWVDTTKLPLLDEAGRITGVLGVYDDITEKKSAEEELRRSRHMLQLVLDTIPARVFWKDRQSRYLGCNKLFARDAGLAEPSEIVGRLDSELAWRDQAAIYRVDDQVVMSSGIPKINYEEPQTTPDGREIFLRTSKVALRDEAGEIIGIMGTYADITDEKRAREALRRSEERLRQALEAANEGLWEWDLASGQAHFSPRCRRMLGYDPEAFPDTYEAWCNLLHPDDRASAGELLRACLETSDGAFEREFRVRTRSGDYRWVLSRGRAIAWSDEGRPARVIGTHVDITDLKTAQETIRKAEHRFGSLYTAMAEGVAIHQLVRDRQGRPVNYRITDVNPQYEQLVGIRADQVRGRLATDAYGTPAPPYLAEFSAPLETGRPTAFETYFAPLHKHFAISVAPLEDDHFATIFFDITERKQAEAERERLLKELEAKNEELESLLYAASHDLRSPLVNILGFSRQLEGFCQQLAGLLDSSQSGLEASFATVIRERIPAAVRFIRTSGSRMDMLINGLLKVCRSGRATLHLERLDMNRLMESVTASLRFQLQESAGRLSVEPLPDCIGDTGQMSQVFSNLLDNAIKYRDRSRPLEVRIEGRAEGGRVVYCVEDNGTGIASDHIHKIWDLFHRLAPECSPPGEGIGLTLVRRIIERHNGRAWVESKPRHGSRFFVDLPAPE